MEASTIWWLAAGAVVVAELLTGTFYLLMVAVGLAAAALAADFEPSRNPTTTCTPLSFKFNAWA